MIDPSQFDVMIDWAFGIATAIYTTIGVTGYLMFGNDVSDEVSWYGYACRLYSHAYTSLSTSMFRT